VDYFVIILSGQAELVTGKEKIVSLVGPFSYFGVSALLCVSNHDLLSITRIVISFFSFLFLKSPENKVEDILNSKDFKIRPFIPDFSLRVCEYVQILRIRRKHWLAAVRANFFENKQKVNGAPPMLNSGGEQIDLLTQELEKTNRVDQLETSEKIRGRAMSLTPTMNSIHVPTEHKPVFSRSRSRSDSHCVDKTSSETPMTFDRNTSTQL